jgi:hypothetical protein
MMTDHLPLADDDLFVCPHVDPDEPPCDDCLAKLGMTPEGESITPAPPTLNDLVTELASARGSLALYKIVEGDARQHLQAKLDLLRTEWEVENADTLNALKAANERVAEAERAVRTATYEAYLATGSKKPHPAVGIRVNTIINYNEADARAWAMDNLKTALKLDAAAFDRAARNKLVPADIAQLEEVAQTTIATDLSAYIIDDESEA